MTGDAAAPWWEAFFDDDYAFLYSAALTPERTEAEVQGVATLLRLKPAARVLDLCCGDGRHAVPLQRRGFRVTGLDASAPLLARAARRASAVGVRPWLIRADARSTPLRSGAFDAAVLLFNSLGYGTDEDSLAMLRSARAAAPQLVIECAHRDEQVRRASPGISREWMEIGEVRVLTERSIDPLEGVAHATFRFGDREKRFRHRLYSATELVALLKAAGYASIDCYGAYDRRPFALDAPLFVAHARAA
jgi:SAM-dependent methyltransferase